jgi:hypothetical protein
MGDFFLLQELEVAMSEGICKWKGDGEIYSKKT